MMNGAASKGTIELNINTYDKGDDTVIFRSTDEGKVWVKGQGKKSREIDLEVAVAWMTRLYLDGYGVTTERKTLPEWALTA